MTGAMYAAVSGLRAHMSALNVIGQNISNVNTLGYKSARYTFNEALYTTSRSGSNGTNQVGGMNPAQLGYGASIGTIDLDMSTKTYTPTGLQMDCMIDGDGMFILGDKSKAQGIKTQTELQGMNLSRLGNFGFDAEGWLTDGNGSVVYGFLCTGYNAETQEYIYSPTLTAIRVPNCTNVIKTRIDKDGKEVQYVDTNVYYPSVKGNTAEGAADPLDPDGNYLAGDIMDGSKPLLSEDGTTITYAPGYTAEQLEALEQDSPEYQELMRQATAKTERVSLANCSIDSTGRITGITQDDELVVVGYVALAKVDNPNGVTHVDGRYYQALGGAGDVHLCSIGGTISYVPTQPQVDEDGNPIPDENAEPINPQTGSTSEITVEGSGDTKLVNGGLEGSGTDLATEISNMIIIQRGYQANTRIVTVTDSMLEELVNMKR